MHVEQNKKLKTLKYLKCLCTQCTLHCHCDMIVLVIRREVDMIYLVTVFVQHLYQIMLLIYVNGFYCHIFIVAAFS